MSKKTLLRFLGEESVAGIKQIAVTLVAKMALRVTGGDLLRQAVTLYIQDCSIAKFPCHHDAEVVELWQAILSKI